MGGSEGGREEMKADWREEREGKAVDDLTPPKHAFLAP
jgi:hypothetical protein